MAKTVTTILFIAFCGEFIVAMGLRSLARDGAHHRQHLVGRQLITHTCALACGAHAAATGSACAELPA
jgi:hypothetical protein